jgi:hypothetical protein
MALTMTIALQNELTLKGTTMQTRIRTQFLIVFTLFSHTAVRAESRLSLVHISDKNIELHLQNSEPVAALQFALHFSSNLGVGIIERIDRTAGSAWMLSFNRANDSTLYVVLIRTGHENLSSGSGAIATIRIETKGESGSSYQVSLSGVVAADPAAQRIALGFNDLQWLSDTKYITLEQNYPNPFNPTTTIPYRLDQADQVRLSIYDITGREVKRISAGMQQAGSHTVSWNSTDEGGTIVPSGIYFVRLQVGNSTEVRKMILTK